MKTTPAALQAFGEGMGHRAAGGMYWCRKRQVLLRITSGSYTPASDDRLVQNHPADKEEGAAAVIVWFPGPAIAAGD